MEHLLDEEATDERVHAFEQERIPHIEESAEVRCKELRLLSCPNHRIVLSLR